jgi:hypothetical protein
MCTSVVKHWVRTLLHSLNKGSALLTSPRLRRAFGRAFISSVCRGSKRKQEKKERFLLFLYPYPSSRRFPQKTPFLHTRRAFVFALSSNLLPRNRSQQKRGLTKARPLSRFSRFLAELSQLPPHLIGSRGLDHAAQTVLSD